MEAYCKTSYIIQAEIVAPGTSVYNWLEGSTGVADVGHDVKLIGTVGEEWLIAREKLPVKYTYPGGTPIDPYALPDGIFDIQAIAGAEIIWAEQVYDQRQVQTSWGEILTANRSGVDHGSGDYVVYADAGGQPNYDDSWIVNGAVFPTTYAPA